MPFLAIITDLDQDETKDKKVVEAMFGHHHRPRTFEESVGDSAER